MAEKFEGESAFLGENTEKYIPFSVTTGKRQLQEMIKKEQESPKLYLTDYNLLIAQGLVQAHTIKSC